MNLSNIKIGTRLGIGFASVLVMLLLISFTAVYKMSTMNAVTDTLVSRNFVETNLATDALDNVRGSIARVFEIVATTNEDSVKEARERLKVNTEKFDAAISQLGSMVVDPDAKVILDKIKESRNRYVAAYEKSIALVASDRDGAAKLAFGDTYKELHTFAADLRDMVSHQQKNFARNGELSQDTYSSSRTQTIIYTLIAIGLGIGAAWWISTSITTPINEAVSIAETIASGDLTAEIASQNRDEAGQLIAALREMNANLVNIVSQVQTGAATITAATADISQGNLDLSARTESQSSALEETASSMEELTSTVRQNADNARQADKLAKQASEVAIKGGDAVSEVVSTMNAINESSKKIVDIISVIDGIAFQTNILALNAAVEAARAGEQGRGFAVVASEVRNLAQRSAAAAKEIKELIGNSVEKVEAGSRQVGVAGSTMNEVVRSIKQVTDIVGEITSASQEQSQGIDQVNSVIIEMDSTTQQNAALVEQAAAASKALSDQSHNLMAVVGAFKIKNGANNDGGRPARTARLVGQASASITSFGAGGERKMTAKRPAEPITRPDTKVNDQHDNKPNSKQISKHAPKEDDWEEF